MSNTAITPYLGGGVGISRNKMGTRLKQAGGSNMDIGSNTINPVCL